MKPTEYRTVSVRISQPPSSFGKYVSLTLLPGATATIVNASSEPTNPTIKKGLTLGLKSTPAAISTATIKSIRPQLCNTTYASEKPPATNVKIPAHKRPNLYKT